MGELIEGLPLLAPGTSALAVTFDAGGSLGPVVPLVLASLEEDEVGEDVVERVVVSVVDVVPVGDGSVLLLPEPSVVEPLADSPVPGFTPADVFAAPVDSTPHAGNIAKNLLAPPVSP